MADYINRKALLKKLCDGDSSRMEDYYYNAIADFPAADVVALPVKYGQTLWRIDGNGYRSPEFQKAVPVTVHEIVYKDVRGKPQWSFIASSTMYSFGGIGKTVFLTKEEAEKVIAKRRENDG